jgi:hypothetical protein
MNADIMPNLRKQSTEATFDLPVWRFKNLSSCFQRLEDNWVCGGSNVPLPTVSMGSGGFVPGFDLGWLSVSLCGSDH